tara:strand:+ start:5547 stop:6755 length:1209 start_codon:yes stop_codon:yes gene_type:complete
MRLTEEKVKEWLRDNRFPVPEGSSAANSSEASAVAEQLGGVAVKAIVPTGRRGKAGAVHLVETPEEAAEAANALIGQEINGYPVKEVYVEAKFPIQSEYYLSFAFGPRAPKLVVSRHGGVEIEQTFERDPDSVVTEDIDPLTDLKPWDAVSLWERAGVEGPVLARLGQLTSRLHSAFRNADAIMIECNPIAVDADGHLSLVGAMMEIDDNAMFRHRDWSSEGYSFGAEGRILNEREIAVMHANETLPGGALRYTELDGNIGILMGGGGASLLQHDMIIDFGGKLANHTDFSPAPSIEKPLAVLNAILENPNTRGLLLSFNYLQLLPCNILVGALCEALRQHGVDATSFPVVVRVFGPGEDEARSMVEEFPGVRYMPPKASLDEAVKLIVDLTNEAVASGSKS